MPSGRNFPGLPGFGISLCLTGCGRMFRCGAPLVYRRGSLATPPGRSSTLRRVIPSVPGVWLPLLRASLLPGVVQGSAVAYQIEQIVEDLVGVFVDSNDTACAACRGRTRYSPRRTSRPPPACMLYPLPPFAMWTAFPSSDYYEGSAPAITVAGRLGHPETDIRKRRQVPRFRNCLSPALGADFTPCEFRPRYRASPYRGWRTARRAPSVRVSIARTNAPRICGSRRRPTRPLPSWQVCTGNEASAIGLVSLAIAGSLAGPATGSEVPVRPALMGSADLWLPGSTRLASPVCSSPRVAPRGVQGLSPREIRNDCEIKALLSLTRT